MLFRVDIVLFTEYGQKDRLGFLWDKCIPFNDLYCQRSQGRKEGRTSFTVARDGEPLFR